MNASVCLLHVQKQFMHIEYLNRQVGFLKNQLSDYFAKLNVHLT